MRPLVLLSLLFSLSVHAAEVRFLTERSKLLEGFSGNLFIENTGSDAVNDARVSIELSEGIEFTPSFVSSWDCTIDTPTRASCVIGRIAPGEYGGISFDARATHGRGGHHTATATLTASNLSNVPPVVFDIVSSKRMVVTTDADFGAGSLRAAIEEINAEPLCGTDVNCNVGFAGPMTLTPATPLPPIRKCNVSIFGPDDIELPRATKAIVISGEKASFGNGLEIRAACGADLDGVSLSGLVVNSWPENGIYFETPEGHVSQYGHSLNQVYVGTDATGTVARPNGSRGIVTNSPHDVVGIFNAVVSGNVRSGIAFFHGRKVSVTGCAVGPGRTGEPLGNGASGIFSYGAPMIVSSSAIAYNGHAGVSIARGTAQSFVSHSNIFANAGLPIDWGLDERTPADDESDRILNAPRVVDAFYDAASNQTIIRGTVRLRAGVFGTDVFNIAVYLAHTTRGDIATGVTMAPKQLFAPAGGNAEEVEFEIALNSDFRGRLIALQTQAGTIVSSEISEALPVR